MRPPAFGAADRLEARLRSRFDEMLGDPASLGCRARAECEGYPEGDLLPFVFPAIGYTNAAIRHPEHAEAHRARVERLVELAIPAVIERVAPPRGDFERMQDYGRQGVYLGQLALALGCHRLIGGDTRWAGIHARIADALHEALVAAEGRPLWSFPDVSWPFDTVPCLLALKLYDHRCGWNRSSDAIARHLQWVQANATDPVLLLPYSQLPQDGAEPAAPRGCDLGYRVWLMRHLDLAYSRRLYREFRRHFWIDRGYLAGFAEWPHGESDAADIDSGPVVKGWGVAATGFGIGAALCMRDGWVLGRLLLELSVARRIFGWFTRQVSDRYPFDPRYVTGSLMGDAAVFAVAGWTSWEPDPVGARRRIDAARGGRVSR